jgi:hypothetical protein
MILDLPIVVSKVLCIHLVGEELQESGIQFYFILFFVYVWLARESKRKIGFGFGFGFYMLSW